MARLFSRSSFRKVQPGQPGYKSETATQYLVLRGKRAGEIVSNAERVRLTKGAHPTKLSAVRKAGTRPYVSAATEAQAKAQIATRKKIETRRKNRHAAIERRKPKPFSLFDRRLKRWRGFRNETAVHLFLNKEGATDSREFKGRNLAIAQNYRDDWYGPEGYQTGAIFTGDGSALAKYEHIKVFDIDGNEVHFETDVEKLRAWWFGMSRRQRNEFEKELFYLRDRRQEAA